MKNQFCVLYFLTITHFNRTCCEKYLLDASKEKIIDHTNNSFHLLKKSNFIDEINKNCKDFDYNTSLNKSRINFDKQNDSYPFVKLSTKKIVKLDLELTRLTKEVSRNLLIISKYKKFKPIKNSDINSKILNIYRAQYKNNIKTLKNFMKNNNNSLSWVLLNAQKKKMELDEELFNLTYKCALGFTKDKSLLNHKKISDTYHKNKKKKNNKQTLESRLKLLEKVLEKNKTNLSNHLTNKTNVLESYSLKKFDHLVKKLYLSQLTLERAYFYNWDQRSAIKNMKKICYETHSFLVNNIKKIKFLMDEININDLNSETLLKLQLLEDKIEYVQMTYNFLLFLLKGKNIPYIKNSCSYIKEQDEINNNNKIIKTINSIKNVKKLIQYCQEN